MTINPYTTNEPYLWIGNYLVYRGKIIGMVSITSSEEKWIASSFWNETAGTYFLLGCSIAESASQAGAMLRLQDWLEHAIVRYNMTEFLTSDGKRIT